MEVVAEGVETEAEFAMMRMFGCSAVQGYYFSRPVPRAACEEMIRKQGEAAPAGEPEATAARSSGSPRAELDRRPSSNFSLFSARRSQLLLRSPRAPPTSLASASRDRILDLGPVGCLHC